MQNKITAIAVYNLTKKNKNKSSQYSENQTFQNLSMDKQENQHD
jgi:hypothetical protein